MKENNAPCAKCGAEGDDHFTAWAYGIPVVGSYKNAPDGRICSIEQNEIDKLRAEVERLQKENLIAWNNWGKENEVLKLQVEVYRKLVEEFSKYSDGCTHIYRPGEEEIPENCGSLVCRSKYALPEKRKP